MSKIFISYTGKDVSIVERIVNGLEKVGYTTWHYKRDALGGSTYYKQAQLEIQKSQAVIFILSEKSLISQHVENEIAIINEEQKPLIPVRYGLTHAEYEKKRQDLRLVLGGRVSIEFSFENVDTSISKIIKSLEGLGIQPKTTEPPDPPSQHETSASRELAISDLDKLADLLIRSGRADNASRTALCIQIGINPNDLNFLVQTAARDFALQLVYHLYQTGNFTAMCQLCEQITPMLKGPYETSLETIQAKVC